MNTEKALKTIVDYINEVTEKNLEVVPNEPARMYKTEGAEWVVLEDIRDIANNALGVSWSSYIAAARKKLKTMKTQPASDREPKIHKLKCWSDYFKQILSGWKTFELRKNDRDFHKGDILILQEWNNETKNYTGRECTCFVPYITEAAGLGALADGFVCMSIKTIDMTGVL